VCVRSRVVCVCVPRVRVWYVCVRARAFVCVVWGRLVGWAVRGGVRDRACIKYRHDATTRLIFL
jgi:hypothetical protein